MADLFAQGRPANEAAADLIIHRLEAQKNYIPSSALVRREFNYVLLKEYRDYIEERTAGNINK